ncbi:unnamed protein product [Sympodiomycopsis kandeliae]
MSNSLSSSTAGRKRLPFTLDFDTGKTSSSHRSSHSSRSSPSSSTPLSQRLRRAVIHDDLPTAKRIARYALALVTEDEDSDHPSVGPQSASLRAWNHHRLPTSTARETCYTSGTDPNQPVFSIRNHDPHYSNYSSQQTTEAQPQSHPLLSICPANNNNSHKNGNTPRPAYPRDSIDAEMDASKTSLQLAIEYKCSLDMIDWLLDMGHEQQESTPGQLRLTRDAQGRSIPHIAAMYNRPDIIALYTSHVHFLLTVARPQVDAQQYIVEEMLDSFDSLQGKTPLHESSIRGHEDCIKLLISLGASIHCLDMLGNSPLHYSSSFGHLASLQLLIEEINDTNSINLNLKNDLGFSPVDYSFTIADRATLEAFHKRKLQQQKRIQQQQQALHNENKEEDDDDGNDNDTRSDHSSVSASSDTGDMTHQQQYTSTSGSGSQGFSFNTSHSPQPGHANGSHSQQPPHSYSHSHAHSHGKELSSSSSSSDAHHGRLLQHLNHTVRDKKANLYQGLFHHHHHPQRSSSHPQRSNSHGHNHNRTTSPSHSPTPTPPSTSSLPRNTSGIKPNKADVAPWTTMEMEESTPVPVVVVGKQTDSSGSNETIKPDSQNRKNGVDRDLSWRIADVLGGGAQNRS